MKKRPVLILLKMYGIIITLLFLSCENNDEISLSDEDPKQDDPIEVIEVITLEATQVSAQSAILNGTISGIRDKNLGFIYSDNALFENYNTINVSDSDIQELSFSKQILNLQPNQEYYYKARFDTIYGESKNFTTTSYFNISYTDSVEVSATNSPIIIPHMANTSLSENCYIDLIPEFSNGYILSSQRTEVQKEVLFAGHNNGDAKIIKMDIMNKSTVWEYSFGGTSNDWIIDVLLLDDGYLVFGLTFSYDGTFSFKDNDSADFFLMKLDYDGNQIFVHNYGTSGNDYPERIIQKLNGNFYLVGETLMGDTRSSTLIEVNSEGEVINENYYQIEYASKIRNIFENSTGELFIGGSSQSYIGGLSSTRRKASLSKISGDNVVWSAFLDGSGWDYIDYVFEKDNNLIVVGQTYSTSHIFANNTTGGSPWFSVFNSNGVVIETIILRPNTDALLKDARLINNKMMVTFEDKTKVKAYLVEVTF